MNSVALTAPRSIEAARFGIATAICGGDWLAMERLAAGKGWSVIEAACKALIAATSMDDVSSATEPVFAGFLAAVRANTLPGKLSPRAGLLNTRQVVGDGTAVATFVDEAQPKPLTTGAFTAMTLVPRKCVAHAVVTDEVVKATDRQAEQVITRELERAVEDSVDRNFVDPTATGSITNGALSVPSTGATTLDGIDADLRSVLLHAGGMTRPTWVLSSSSAVRLAALRGSGGSVAFPQLSITGGLLMGVPAVTSRGAVRAGSPTENVVALIDADAVVYADSGRTELSITKDASVMMLDDPAAGVASLVSLWQNNLLGIRLERWLAWARVRNEAVVVLDGNTW